ncbi:MAG: N-acetylmuramoyl-L-alanine amidase [Gordonia sp. (in: high G+C Gram-positive bacteria)]|uniref:N-acetylmuramoyl-L-alanine amidase n=1 Tax=Gordonia sp. (in: high G+C Gram-positive bacteria) TaxID=84139 RepID=UPI003C794899
MIREFLKSTVAVLPLLFVAGCGNSATNNAAVTVVETVTAGEIAPNQSTTDSNTNPKTAETPTNCKIPVVALDPGHNGEVIAEIDTKTGIAMRDYPNGAEDSDAMAVSKKVKKALEDKGYKVILLKESITDSVSYRERVNRAEKAGADIGISIHTYTDDHRVFPQRVGLFREGQSSNGETLRVTFTNAKTADQSLAMAEKFATIRSETEGRTVSVSDNSFDGRAPLWSGNIPVISLISETVPWVYNEFGMNGGGGANPLGDAGITLYSKSLAKSTEAALPISCR